MRAVRGLRIVVCLWVVLWAALGLTAGVGAQAETRVDVLSYGGAISAATFDYFDRGIRIAEREAATAVIIELNTPGGDVGTTLKIMQRFENARVPVVIYIYPRGSLAASAGTYITLSAHVAAMAPKTTIGAASPVGGGGEELPKTIKEKLVNTLTGQAKRYAERRGEKAVEWAEKAVTEALVANEREALELGVIDLVADDLNDLLDKLDGREVELASGTVTLHTKGADVNPVPMSFIEQLLAILINHNTAFILLTLGVNALLFELSSPGGYVSGIVGIICIILALYSFQVLSVNYMGLALIGLAFVLFVLDIKAPTHGVLTVGGIVSLVFGALILFNTPYYVLSRGLVFSVALATGGFFAFAMAKVVRIQSKPPVTGIEGLIGQPAEVRTALAPKGTVFLKGELWQAVAEDGPIDRGEMVEVVAADGFCLRVRKRDR